MEYLSKPFAGNQLMKSSIRLLFTSLMFGTFCVSPVIAEDSNSGDSEAELAKKIQNPVANLVSVPFQNNWDFGIGTEDAMQYTLNVQPVIPFSITEEYNLITRTIMPVVYAESPVPNGDSHTGLSDIIQSFFFSPKDSVGGWILGGGPVFLYPSATEVELGSGKWGTGPTIVALRQEDGWTYGFLGNQINSIFGQESREQVSKSFLQPFVSYTTKTYTTFGVNTESTYDWKNDQWTVPVNVFVSQLVKVCELPISLLGGIREYSEAPDGGPNWGLRFQVQLLFPK